MINLKLVSLNKKSTKTGTPEEEVTEGNAEKSDESEVDAVEELNAEEAADERSNSGIGYSNSTTPIKVSAQTEVPEHMATGGLDGSGESDPGSSEEMNAEMRSYEGSVIDEVNAEANHVSATEDGSLTKACEPVEAQTKRLNVEISSFVPDVLEMSTEEGKVDVSKIETNSELNKFEGTKLDDSHMVVGNDEVLQEVHHTSEKVEETSQCPTSGTAISELIADDSNGSPQKLRELDPLLMSTNESPSSMQTRCVWSPLASPSTSILKRGLKRPQEDEIPSPVNKVGKLRLNVNETLFNLNILAIQ